MKVSTRVFSRAVLCALLSLTAVAWAATARAQTVTVTAKGTIAPTCSMSATQSFGASSFNAAGTTTAKASVSCNQFFKVTATSAKGAIKSSAPVSGQFTNTIPYTLTADVTLDGGSTSAKCDSSALVAGQSSCLLSPANNTGLTSNGQIASDKTTTLTVSWTPPTYPTLLAVGSYSDLITLTIATVP